MYEHHKKGCSAAKECTSWCMKNICIEIFTCFRKCGNDKVKGGEEKDPFLCGMQGVKFISGAWKPGPDFEPGMHIVQMMMHGHVEETVTAPYGMVGVVNGRAVLDYGVVDSPKCPQVLCESTCPLKLSEFSLLTQDCS